MTTNGNGQRKFDDKPAVRERVPLLVGLVGPSGSGKTFSALRLATGIQRVAGGDIYVIDTEAKRALHYADKFKFRHIPFLAPFSPLDYLAAIKHCVDKGAKTIVIDSMSHEHEGPGGVLEEHQSEMERLAKAWGTSLDKTNMPAWAVPKGKRRILLNAITQMEINLIFCFRSKKKIRIISGKQPEQRGWMPIAGEEFIYELTAKCLLYPGSRGVPMWTPVETEEREMFKLPEQFRDVFAKAEPLSDIIGEKLARWAAGEAPVAPPPAADEKLAKDRAGWMAYWARGGIAEERILAAIGRASVAEVDRMDLKTFDDYSKAIKSKAKTKDEIFPPASTAPPPDDDVEPGEDRGDAPSADEMAS